MMSALHADAERLIARLGTVERRIRELVAQRRTHDPNPDDPFRGLYFSEEMAARLLDLPRVSLDPPTPAGEEPLRLQDLARTFALEPLDVEILLIALAADLDPRFEQLFGYLNDDVTRRRPSVAVALALCGQSLASATARARVLHGPLAGGRLIVVEDVERPFASRGLRVPDRVVGHLLGDDTPDPALAPLAHPVPLLDWGRPETLADLLADGSQAIYLREPATGSGRVLAAGALRRAGRAVLGIDLAPLVDEPYAVEVLGILEREARLTGAGIVAGAVDALERRPELLDRLTRAAAPVLLVGEGAWDPEWTREQPALVDVPASTLEERAALWASELTDVADGVDHAAATSQFRLRPEQVVRAAAAARRQARLAGDVVIGVEHLRAGVRAENGTALERLARRIRPAVTWQDLVLPEQVVTGLREIALRARHREQVLGAWRMRPGGGRGRGVAGLFAGDSGTGKTMAAEVVAADLGLDLYVVDLATVVDKYIGETEKNLERIFTAAQGVNAVLLFDEADSIFGKRSEVKDAHDRYANIESAYLLQRLESFDGLAVLATNLRSNIDDAFTRRLDVLVDFPLPDAEHRRLLWERCLGTLLPRAADLDLTFCAEAFELAGGAIRSAATTAAYLAAADGTPVTMRHLVAAVQREYRKLGRLTVESEFGDYWSLLQPARL